MTCADAPLTASADVSPEGGDGGADDGASCFAATAIGAAEVGTPSGTACEEPVFCSLAGGGPSEPVAAAVAGAQPLSESAAGRFDPAAALKVAGADAPPPEVRAARATLEISMRLSSHEMMRAARSIASFRFSAEQLGDNPMRFKEFTICATNCAEEEKKRS
eukprot:scaffold153799_cov29-Tisochrysis_lutea.AAC.7